MKNSKISAAERLCVNKVHQGDSRILCGRITPNSISTTITSPPYFDMKDYGVKNQIGYGQSYEKYLEDLKDVFSKIFIATKSNGSLWVIIDTFRRGQEVLTLPFDLAARLKPIGWTLRDIIIWKKERTLPWVHEGATRKIFEYVLVFGKQDENIFYQTNNLRDTTDLKRWWVRYPERYNPKGKSLEEIWNFDIPTQGSWGNSYVRHFCPLPAELVDRIIDLTSSKGDLIFDPFAGSGTVPAEALAKQRNYLGIELNSDYIKLFEEYVKSPSYLERAHNLSQNSLPNNKFEETIIKLRVLKLARLLAKELVKEFGEKTYVFASLKKKSTKTPNKICEAQITILSANSKNSEKMLALVMEKISQRPLSKFGVACDVVASTVDDFRTSKSTLYSYSLTNSHKFRRAAAIDTLIKAREHVISDIGLRVEEPND